MPGPISICNATPRVATPPASVRAIAVLPLRNIAGDPAQEYFVDGMTEAIISDLSRIKALRVISRTSAMKYKGSTLSVPEIARELNVDAVLEGSAEDALRRLVEASFPALATEFPSDIFPAAD